MTPHEKFMRDAFGRPVAETRRIVREMSDQSQQTPPAIPGEHSSGDSMDGHASQPTEGSGPTTQDEVDVVKISDLEDWAIDLRHALNRFPRLGWGKASRDHLGTLWVNIAALKNAAGRLEEQLKAHLDATRRQS